MPSITRFERRALPGRAAKIVVIKLASLFLVLAAVRLLLPWAGVKLVNDQLAELDGFSGRIESADLRLLEGGFTLHDAVVRRDEGADGKLRVDVEQIDVSFSWIHLTRGEFVGKIVVTRPVVFSAAGLKKETPREERRKWREVLAASPRFELTRLNPLLFAAAEVDASAGTLEVEAGFRAAEGYYEGQVTPFVRAAEFSRAGEGRSLLQGVKEMALDVAATVLANDKTERVASEVPFSGKFGEGEVDAWNAFVTLLGNALGDALLMGRVGNE